MSEVRLVIRDANEDRSGTVHGSVADWFAAALSADPVSIAELDAAIDRYALQSPERGHLTHFRHDLNTEPWDAGLVVIDLAARLVMIDSTYSSPGHNGSIQRHNIESVEGGTVSLSYRLADDWLFLRDSFSWKGTAEVRRRQRAEQPACDLREIFYGPPMLRSIINGCRRQFAGRDEIAARVHQEWIESRRHWNERYATEPQPDPETLSMHELARVEDPTADLEHRIYYDTIRDIHADWLMTPCAELGGRLPRTVMLQDRDRLSGDMSDREHHWSILGRCPPGISPESHAFQFGGFNTNEIVMYYDYVREVAWSCWDHLRTLSDAERAELETSRSTLEAFVNNEIKRLRKVGEQWLSSPWDEDPMRTPQGIINLERRRQPNGGQFHPIDPDCPCCQALAEMPGIGFWHMDGCNMDDLFAFAYYHDTIESWESDQADYQEFSRQIDQQHDLAKEWCLPSQYSKPSPDVDRIWRLVVKTEGGEIPLGHRLNNVAHGTVSLIVQLRIDGELDTNFVIEQYEKNLQHRYVQLKCACEKSAEYELSSDVETSVACFLDAVDELTSDLERYLDQLFDHESSDDDSEAGFRHQTPQDFRWRKLFHKGRELRYLLQSFVNIQKEESCGDWHADDLPF